MLRTWAVRFPAMEFTLSVRSFQVPATPGTSAWPPNLPSVPTSRATRDCGRDFGDVADLGGKIPGHGVHAVGEVLPGASHAQHIGLPTKAPFRTDLARHARDLAGERIELIDHRVDGLFELEDLSAH